MELLNQFKKFEYFEESILTAILLILVFFIKAYLAKKNINLEDREYEDKIEQRKNVIRLINVFFYISLILIWSTEVQNFIVSIFAVAAAVVLATKELIMNATGGLLVRFNHAFKVRDRIEIDHVRGFVIEKGITFTKVLEIGPEKESQQTTGSIISIPNSVFLSKPVKNESYFKGYSIKSFIFHLDDQVKLKDAEDFLSKTANEILKSYAIKAEHAIGSFCRKEGLSIPQIGVRVKVIYSAEGKINLLLKMPVRNDHIADLEQKLIREYLDFISSSK